MDQEEADRVMESARSEVLYDHEIREALREKCGLDRIQCDAEYYCKPDGVWRCKECDAEADI